MTDLIEYIGENPVSVIVDGDKFDEFYKRISAEVLAEPVDLETAKGRKAIVEVIADGVVPHVTIRF